MCNYCKTSSACVLEDVWQEAAEQSLLHTAQHVLNRPPGFIAAIAVQGELLKILRGNFAFLVEFFQSA